MTNYKDNVKSIEKIIKKGYVRHDKIEPALEKAELSQIKPDDISELVKLYKYRETWWARGKTRKAIRSTGEKICSYLSAFIVAVVTAEIIAARQFAESLIGDKLQGFGSNLLFWLGLKKIEISGPDMARAMAEVGFATPNIIKGVVIGALAGYLAWKIITRLVGYLLRRYKRRKDIADTLVRYGLTAEESNIIDEKDSPGAENPL